MKSSKFLSVSRSTRLIIRRVERENWGDNMNLASKHPEVKGNEISFKCDNCGSEYKIKFRFVAGVSTFFECPTCKERYNFGGVIISSRKVDYWNGIGGMNHV